MYFPEQKKNKRFEGQNMGGIKDMLSPPCQNMGGIYHPHPPQDLRPCCLLICNYHASNCIMTFAFIVHVIVLFFVY